METTEIILALIAIFATVVTHWLDKKKFKQEVDKLKQEVEKAKAEVDENKIDNMGKTLDFYEKWVDKTNERLNDLVGQVDSLVSENAKLNSTIENMERTLNKLDEYLCTDLPCKKRVKDKNIIDCAYLNKSKKKINKKSTETLNAN